MSVPTIYAFQQNDEGTVLNVIACCGYKKELEGDRERAISEIQQSIQYYDAKEMLIIDGIKLLVMPVNTIKI
jgi:hypothetical protein